MRVHRSCLLPASFALAGCGPAGTVECAIEDDNVLRLQCATTFADEAPVRLRATAAGEEDLVVDDDAVAADHLVHVHGLLPATDYEIVAEQGGELARVPLVTRSLPSSVRPIDVVVEVDGEPGFSWLAVAATPRCTGDVALILVVDPRGRVRWYQWLEPQGEDAELGISGLEVVDGGAFLIATGNSRLLEIDLDGRILLDLAQGRDFEHPLHHDVARDAEGRSLALYAREGEGVDGGSYIIDGVYAFSPEGVLEGTWDVADVATIEFTGVEPTVPYWAEFFPFARDWGHANGLNVTPSGDWILSWYLLDAAWKVDGQIGTAGFGRVQWKLAGSDEAVEPGDFVRSAGEGVSRAAGFARQHDVSLHDDGTLTVFDNEVAPDESNVQRWALDEEAGTATLVEAHGLGANCIPRGGVEDLGGAGLVATCLTDRTVSAFTSDGGDTPAWSARLECVSADGGLGASAIPHPGF